MPRWAIGNHQWTAFLYTPRIVLDLAPWPDADAILDAALEAVADDGFLDATSGDGARLIAEWRQHAGAEMPALAPGDVLGVYHILDSLGSGGMGEVYRARDASLGREVAIKVLPHDVRDDAIRLARFRREARLLASLNHPHVGAIYTVVEDERRLALVLELVEGPTLAARLVQGPIPMGEALVIARKIAEALQAAHEKGVVHRDLKPANIKLSSSGRVKVLDFGIAKAIAADGDESAEPSLTGAGPRGALGTAAYMSP
jgi:serine/threonine-protein kinase